MSIPPTTPTPATAADGTTLGTSTGLEPKVAGLLAYLGIVGIVLFLLEKEHREVRFHAAQNTVLCIGLFGVYVALSVLASAVPSLWLLNLPLVVASLGLWVLLLFRGYHLDHLKLPVVGDIAERWAGA